MHRGDLAKELAPWAGYGDKFLKALRLAYVLGTEHALAIAVKTAMGDLEDLGEWESIEYLVQQLLVQKLVAEEKKKSADQWSPAARCQFLHCSYDINMDSFIDVLDTISMIDCILFDTCIY